MFIRFYLAVAAILIVLAAPSRGPGTTRFGFSRRAVGRCAGKRHQPRDLRCRHEGIHSRSAGDRGDPAPAGIRQTRRRLCECHRVETTHRGRAAQGPRMGKDFRCGRKEVSGRTLGVACLVGHGIGLRIRKRSLGRFPLARHARLCEISRSLFSQRADRGDAHHAGQSHRPRKDGQLMGRRHGPNPVHAVELRRLCDRFFRRRARRHLGQRAGCACVDCQLPAQVEMESGASLGLRGSRAGRIRLHAQPREFRGVAARSASAAPTARRFPIPDRASSSFPAARAVRASSSRKISLC